MTLADPSGLRLLAPFSQQPDGLDAGLLDSQNGIDQTRGVCEAVSGGEHLDPVTSVGGLGVAQPSRALVIVAERRGVFERVVSCRRGAGRAWSQSMIPIGCSLRQTVFHGPKSPWQTSSSPTGPPILVDQRAVPDGR